jgi:NTE family protein
VRASIAIPTVFTPVIKENSILVDGGVMNNVPINHVKRTKDDVLIVVYVNADIPVNKPPISKKEKDKKQSVYLAKIKRFYSYLNISKSKSKDEKLGYFDIMNKTISLLTYQLAQLLMEKYSPDILINVSRNSCGAFDFYKAEELVEIGRLAAINSLEDYNNRLD